MAVEEQGDGPVVSYTVREILAEIRAEMRSGFDRLSEKLDSKADRSDVNALKLTVDSHDGRLATLEHARENSARHSADWRNWIVAAAGMAMAVAAVVAFFVH